MNGKGKFMIIRRLFSTHIKVPKKVMIQRRVNPNKVKPLIPRVRLLIKRRNKVNHYKTRNSYLSIHQVINLKKKFKITLAAQNKKSKNFLKN
jgi:hypothetical protein